MFSMTARAKYDARVAVKGNNQHHHAAHAQLGANLAPVRLTLRFPTHQTTPGKSTDDAMREYIAEVKRQQTEMS